MEGPKRQRVYQQSGSGDGNVSGAGSGPPPWPHGLPGPEVHLVLSRLGLLQSVQCEASPPTPYQAVQDLLFSSQEALQTTYRTSVAGAQAQLLALQMQTRTQLYTSYLDQVAAVSPTFRDRGRRVGERILSQMLADAAPMDMAKVNYSSSCKTSGLSASALAAMQRNTAGGQVSAAELEGAAESQDTALALLDDLAAPFLSPFTDGLKEPFAKALGDYHQKVQTALLTQGVTLGLSGLLLGGIVGYVCGRARRSQD